MKKKNNKIYYHYCSVDTFYNILQTGTIRFGNPLNMNDSAEIIWLLERVKDFVLEREAYNSILEGWDLIENILRALLQEMDCPYIFCLSKDKDVLSQWRSYANDGKGVAIGFDVDFIETHYSLYGAEVIYDREKQYDILSQKISDDVLRNLNIAVKEGDREEIRRKSIILASHILSDAMMCKNPAFQEEKEYRLYCRYRKQEKGISDIKFRVNDCSIIPFRELCFKDIECHLIKNIVVGPKSSINNRNLWLFLKSKGFKWIDVDSEGWNMNDSKWKERVIVSQATYR